MLAQGSKHGTPTMGGMPTLSSVRACGRVTRRVLVMVRSPTIGWSASAHAILGPESWDCARGRWGPGRQRSRGARALLRRASAVLRGSIALSRGASAVSRGSIALLRRAIALLRRASAVFYSSRPRRTCALPPLTARNRRSPRTNPAFRAAPADGHNSKASENKRSDSDRPT